MKTKPEISKSPRSLTNAEIEAVSGAGAVPQTVSMPVAISASLKARIEKLKSELHEAIPRP